MGFQDKWQDMLYKLDMVQQGVDKGELITSFELLEQVSIQIELEKKKCQALGISNPKKNTLCKIIERHAFLKRKLLKEMVKNL